MLPTTLCLAPIEAASSDPQVLFYGIVWRPLLIKPIRLSCFVFPSSKAFFLSFPPLSSFQRSHSPFSPFRPISWQPRENSQIPSLENQLGSFASEKIGNCLQHPRAEIARKHDRGLGERGRGFRVRTALRGAIRRWKVAERRAEVAAKLR